MTTTQLRSAIRYPKAARPVSLTPLEVARAYHFPVDHATGKGYVGGIIELGGGYTPKQVATYFSANRLPLPVFVPVPVGGAKNAPDGPDGADGEVQLDMIVAGAVAPGALWRVYFAPNTDAGFLQALTQACKECNGVTISWGGAENGWDPGVMAKFEAVIAAARARGVPVFVASGDTGSQDSSGAGNQTDFPASSPSAIGCGGTRLTILANGERSAEVVWDDNDLSSATGGGISKAFPGRQVPDIAGNADPNTGYDVMIDGQAAVVGGTSAVAPLMCGLHALLWEINGGKGFDFGNLTVTNPQAFFDVTQGDNGGYRAGQGRDNTTGVGVPDGAALAGALTSGIPAPAPPTPVPPTPADPLTDFPVTPTHAWIGHGRFYTQVETAAARAISAWGSAHGLKL